MSRFLLSRPAKYTFYVGASRRSPRLAGALLALLLAGCRGDRAGNPAGLGGGDHPPGDLCISEIMYHPVDEQSLEDVHEFIEITNRSDKTHQLEGLRLKGVGFTFSKREIAPGERVVVAKDPDALLTLSYYDLDPRSVLGGYSGQLANGGETISLTAANGANIDSVSYEDKFPWPIAADGLGVGESWLDASYLPLSAHRHGGISLERISCKTKANDPGNWEASDIDAASPGQAYSGVAAAPRRVVLAARARAAAGASTIQEGDEVEIAVTFNGARPESAIVEYFRDDLSFEGEPIQSAPLDSLGVANLPPMPENSIVRFRIVAPSEAGNGVVSPRPSDPYEFHSYFVEPAIETETPVYHIFLAPERWTELWDNVLPGRADGCNVNDRWQSRVPGAFVFQGRVYDVQVRYQGSRWNRTNGPDLHGYQGDAPSRPSPPKGLSLRIGFPRYDHFAGRSVTILNKLTQGCPGFTTAVGLELFRRVGIPASSSRYVRVHVNGGYYRYMQEIERVDDDLMKAYHASTDLSEVGHLFKVAGLDGDEGPWGWGDARLLQENCGFDLAERYAATYPRQTHEWAGPEMIMDLISGLHEARSAGPGELRAYLAEQFDVDMMLDYLAVMNYLAPFDDMYHNHWYYRRLNDGKWFVIPWDLDLTMGGNLGAESSVFVGEEGDPSNARGVANVMKDSFFEAYRDEYLRRLQALNRDVLSPPMVQALIEEVRGQANISEAQSAPGGTSCDYEAAAEEMKDFAEARSALINDVFVTPF